jgi:hypothetical protein
MHSNNAIFFFFKKNQQFIRWDMRAVCPHQLSKYKPKQPTGTTKTTRETEFTQCMTKRKENPADSSPWPNNLPPYH